MHWNGCIRVTDFRFLLRMVTLLPALIGFWCGLGLDTVDASSSIAGKEFLFTFAQNYENANDARLLLVNQSPGLALVTITVPAIGMTPRIAVVHQDSSTVISLPSAVVPTESYDGLGGYGIFVNSSMDICVFGINDAHPASMDGFAVIPVPTLGREYMVASYIPWSQSQISLVAVEDNTLVTITLSTSWRHTNIDLKRGENLRFNLNKFQTVHLDGKTDPTGSRIISNKPISVLTGCRCAFVPATLQSCDHLVEQIPPFHQWGKSFIASAMIGRNTSTIYRLIAGRSNTNISFSDDRDNRMLSQGEFFEFEIDHSESVYIHSSMPCLLVAYAKGNEADSIGDPTMSIVPPLDQGVHTVTFVTYNFTKDGDLVQSYVSILGECFTLENATINGVKVTDQGAGLSYRTIGTSRHCVARFPVPMGAYIITAHRHYTPFVAFAYGFADFNSYGYPIGMGTAQLTCYTPRPEGGQPVEHFCNERVVLVPSTVIADGAHEEQQCDYSECVYPIHVILIALATAAGAIVIEFYLRRKFSERRKEREKKRRRSMMRAAAAAISSLSFNRERRPALTSDVTEEA